jgi:hypothetical protein
MLMPDWGESCAAFHLRRHHRLHHRPVQARQQLAKPKTTVIPAKAGIQTRLNIQPVLLDSRLRGYDEREVITFTS